MVLESPGKHTWKGPGKSWKTTVSVMYAYWTWKLPMEVWTVWMILAVVNIIIECGQTGLRVIVPWHKDSVLLTVVQPSWAWSLGDLKDGPLHPFDVVNLPLLLSTVCYHYRVAILPWKSLKVLEIFSSIFQGPEKSFKNGFGTWKFWNLA